MRKFSAVRLLPGVTPPPPKLRGGKLPPGQTVEVKRLRHRRGTLLRLAGLLLRHPLLAALAAALTVGGNLLALQGPALSGKAINAIGKLPGQADFPAVFRFCGYMVICYAASSVLSYLLSLTMVRLSQRVVRRMRADTFDRLAALPVGYFDAHQAGDIVSRFSYDIDTVGASLSGDLPQIINSVITVTGSLIMMLTLSPLLSLIVVVTVPISLFFAAYMTRRVRPLFRRRSARLGALNGYVEETLSGHRAIQAYQRQQVMLERFDVQNEEAVDAYYYADYYGTMVGPGMNFVNNLSLVLTSVCGSLLYLSGRLDLGFFASFIQYSRKFAGPINEIANILSELQSACSAAERVFRLQDELPEAPDAPDAAALTAVAGQVTLRDVHFAYTPDAPLMQGVSLTAAPGALVAVVGPTGAGKTTLINLLMRFYDPDGGVIAVDGTDIRALTRDSLRRAYAMVLQDTWLFHGTVFENLAYGKADATREEVAAAARAAGVHAVIEALPDGYDTVLSEEGGALSQGQKQLLTIARAMLLDTHMLILDEATSNVDTRTERRIQAAMRELMRGKTCFVIAHRLSTVQAADVILVVREGAIVEQGSHAALLAQGGIYAALYEAQFA